MINNELIEEAKRSLQVIDVHLDSAEINSDDDYEFAFPLEEKSLSIQLKSGPADKYRRFKASLQGGGGEMEMIRFEYFAAFRIIVEGLPNEDEEEQVLAEVMANFRAYYKVKNPNVSDECLTEFSAVNVGYHVWPYWREFASSVASRLRLPPFVIPIYRI